MTDNDDHFPAKSDDAKGEDTARTHLDKEANEAAQKAGKTEHNYDKKNDIFTK